MSFGRFREPLARWIGQRFFFGWAMLGVASLGIFVSGAGQSHTFSVFVGPIGRDLGLSETTIASAYGSATLVAAFCLPLMGRMVDRNGARRMLLIVTLCLGLACFAFGAAGMIWLAFSFAALRFLGQGSLMMICTNLVSQWFARNRGFAISLMTLGFSVSMAVHPAVSQLLIEWLGWRQAWVWIGLSTWALLLPPVLFLVLNRPADIGMLPDGAAAPAPVPAGSTLAARAARVDVSLTLNQALRSPAFYIVATGLCTMSMMVTALHFFQVSIFATHDLDAGIASRVFAVSAITMVVSMPLVGRMLDRLPTHFMFSAGLVTVGCALAGATLVDGLLTAIAYAVVFGLSNAFTITLYGFLWPRYFGLKHLGSIMGIGQMIGVVGASIGPLPLGVANDWLGGYDPMLLGMATVPAAWAVVALFLREPKAD